jgi:hypothetical protein
MEIPYLSSKLSYVAYLKHDGLTFSAGGVTLSKTWQKLSKVIETCISDW